MRCRAKERVIRSGARARDGRGCAQGEARIADSHLRGSETDNATATEWCAIVAGARQGTIGHDLTVKRGALGPNGAPLSSALRPKPGELPLTAYATEPPVSDSRVVAIAKRNE
jgi:hypothetical protein